MATVFSEVLHQLTQFTEMRAFCKEEKGGRFGGMKFCEGEGEEYYLSCFQIQVVSLAKCSKLFYST